MESHDLWIFKHVAELQSISRAAEKLGYVQPNISQRIKNLEDELGVKILKRNNRGVTLTEEGKVLLDYTNEIMLLMNEAKSKINPQKWRESLTIGASQTISAVKVPQLFSSFLASYKNMDVKIRTNDNAKLQEMLLYGELDGIFLSGTYNHSQLETVYSYYENIILISSKHNPLENQILLVNSDPNCIYRQQLLDYCNKNDFDQKTIMEFDSLESIMQAAHDGLGISIIPANVAYSRTKTKAIHYEELPETVKIDFVIKRRKQQPQSLKKFIRFLKEL
ncbi:LysR family transcriptional regulator [Bacillus pseudomycoides]|uniref:LysR family transcriptional regulator n=1 Tax=Bacillus TaxID=1386 RepID=UPI00037B4658|nr:MULTISPECIES: LysR family transcriptional regulator [Bacillus]MCX2825957.1 LysR family transcriptional regulator [Bacillus sp. DHT2]MDR4913930.1 LysR family transcriptional regulator [Bacillus pseudomycoides]PDX99556.1 LysR family transcriptional regulator [Bacillus pseudomycoides]PEK78479.1 LysR family transcriptional regulator [Bacillus pseudomycoides]PEN01852.1 LysR family transcriptional regulator [Bacillus pseudomycoides]